MPQDVFDSPVVQLILFRLRFKQWDSKSAVLTPAVFMSQMSTAVLSGSNISRSLIEKNKVKTRRRSVKTCWHLHPSKLLPPSDEVYVFRVSHREQRKSQIWTFFILDMSVTCADNTTVAYFAGFSMRDSTFTWAAKKSVKVREEAPCSPWDSRGVCSESVPVETGPVSVELGTQL